MSIGISAYQRSISEPEIVRTIVPNVHPASLTQMDFSVLCIPLYWSHILRGVVQPKPVNLFNSIAVHDGR